MQIKLKWSFLPNSYQTLLFNCTQFYPWEIGLGIDGKKIKASKVIGIQLLISWHFISRSNWPSFVQSITCKEILAVLVLERNKEKLSNSNGNALGLNSRNKVSVVPAAVTGHRNP